jgi:hypothetical protein
MINFYIAAVFVGFFIAPLKMIIGGWAPYMLMDGMVIVLVVNGLVHAIQQRGVRPIPITTAYFALALYCVVGLLNPEGIFLRGLMGLRSLLLYPALMFAGFACFTHERQVTKIYRALIVLGVVTALVGIWQWNAGPAALAAWGGSYGDFARRMVWIRGESGILVFRPFSTFAQPGVFGATMTLTALIVLSELLASGIGLARRITMGIAIAIMTTGLLVSASRLSMIELILGAVLMAFLTRGLARRTGLAVQGAVILYGGLWVATAFAGPMFRERFQGLDQPAIYFWRWMNPLMEGFRQALDHPLGLGPGYAGGIPFFVSASWIADLGGQYVRNVDSGIGAIAAEYGIPGVILFLFFFIRVAWIAFVSWRALPPSPLKDRLRAPVVFAFIGVAVTPIADMMRPAIPSAIIFWFTLGMLMKAPFLVPRYRMPAAMHTLARRDPRGRPRLDPVRAPAAYPVNLVKPFGRSIG